MHILKYIFSFILLTLFISCKPAGPLTADEALTQFQGYYKNIDTYNLMKILPQEDKVKLESTLILVNEMNTKTRNAFAENYNLNPDRIKNLTTEEYLYVIIKVIKENDPELFTKITDSKILSMNETKNSAEITLTSKIKISLKKTGPYWKVHLPGI